MGIIDTVLMLSLKYLSDIAICDVILHGVEGSIDTV